MRYRSLLLFVLLVAGCSDSKKPVSYRTDIQPILNSHCLRCHGGEKSYRKITMASYQDVMRSQIRSTKTPIVIPGQVAKSWLYILAATKQVHFRMPPDTSDMTPFTEEEVKLLARWIQEGALDN